MIRIDEIYHTVFWPWLQRSRPRTRMFYFWPFGKSDTDSICSYTGIQPTSHNLNNIIPIVDDIDNNYTVFFDQEPIDLARHRAVFDKIKNEKNANIDIEWQARNLIDNPNYDYKASTRVPPATGLLVTSEKDSESVEQICEQLGWQSFYYFFHGWAALDWFRGYNYSPLITAYRERTITRTFIMPNRIIAGQREHRLIMLYYIFKLGMANNHISCPSVCPAENVPILAAVDSIKDQLPDAPEIFQQQLFPICFAGETDSPMHSYQLSLFAESAESLLYLVTETVATGRRQHLTEKIFKPICLRMPFIVVGTQGSLKYLQSYGFQTFCHLWDESYDDEPDDHLRIEKIARVLKDLDQLNQKDKQKLFLQAEKICEYNYNHFYSGRFEEILQKELKALFDEIGQV